MPTAAPRPCRRPGCPKLVAGSERFCDDHRLVVKREIDAVRDSAAKRGYGRKWQAAREQWLAEHPLCQCEECDEGRVRLRPATVVDHRIPHKGDLKLFWDRKNWQSMAKECHDRKTAREDGGFGRPIE
jgi:5-methylcytosine-specific restriction protein A